MCKVLPDNYIVTGVEYIQNSSAHWSDITKAEYTGVGIGVVLTIQDNAVKYDCCILTMDRTYG